GPALKGRRDKMYMGFAMWPECPRNKKWCTAEQLLKTFEEGLKLAQVDYVDVWRLVASTPGRHSEADELEFIKAFETAKKQGKARFTGVSSHGRKWIKRLAENYSEHYQVMLFPYTVASKELPKDSMFDAIRKHDIGTFGIKPFGSNSLFKGVKTPEEKSKRARLTIRNILGNPAITAPIPGLACVEEVDNMALAIKESRKLTTAEAEELRIAGQEMMANLPQEYQWLKDWQYV
ncbi:MAG: aldo/keto reductase, partial [Phycisphaerae bacterium]|nr:aldo/keto reductase [Phycisphaerae bacterium]